MQVMRVSTGKNSQSQISIATLHSKLSNGQTFENFYRANGAHHDAQVEILKVRSL